MTWLPSMQTPRHHRNPSNSTKRGSSNTTELWLRFAKSGWTMSGFEFEGNLPIDFGKIGAGKNGRARFRTTGQPRVHGRQMP